MTLKNGFGKWMKRSKHGLFVFPPKKILIIMEKALFDWPIVLQYDVKAKYRLISRKFAGMKFFHPSVRETNQKLRAFVSVPQTNQMALFPFVCCFCFLRAFSVQGHTKIALFSCITLSSLLRKVGPKVESGREDQRFSFPSSFALVSSSPH